LKRFFLLLSSLFCAVLVIFSPLVKPIKAHAAYSSSLSDFSHNPNDNYYIFFSFDNDNYCYGWYFSISKINYNSNMVSWNGNIATFNNNQRTSFYLFRDSSHNYSGSDNSISSISIDFTTKKIVNVVNHDFPGNDFKNLTNYYDTKNGEMYFGDTLDTNIPDLVPPEPLNLDFDFTPYMSGSVNRSITQNNVLYDSPGLNIYCTNNGENAQFCLFIVNHGDDISFTSQINSNYGYSNQGFIGSPVYAFVTDEWVTVDTGLATPIYLDSYYQASIWHYVAAGDTYYNVAPWSNMNLHKDTQYDLVCYACLNDVPQGYSSLSCGDSVEEVYRTTFSMFNPAVYNPTDVSVSGVYPWNNESQTNDIFNHSSAYQDSTGKITIRSEYGNSSFYGNGVQSASSLNTYFKDYFAFINGGLSCFPSVFLTILSAGITGVVVIGIVKVAFRS